MKKFVSTVGVIIVAICVMAVSKQGVSAKETQNKNVVSMNGVEYMQDVRYELIPGIYTKSGNTYTNMLNEIGTAAMTVNGIYYEYNAATDKFEPSAPTNIPSEIGTAAMIVNGIYYEYNAATDKFEPVALTNTPSEIGTAAMTVNGIYYEYNDTTGRYEKNK